MEIRRIITYKSDFYINFIGVTLISFFISFSLWQSIFYTNQVNELNGMSLNYLISYSLLAPLSFRIIQGHQIGFLSREIYEGDLNKYLIYPASILKTKFSGYLAQSLFYLLQLVLIIVLLKFIHLKDEKINITFQSIILYFCFIIVTILFYFILQAIIECIAFWADNIWSLAVLLRMAVSIFSGAIIPLNLFPEWSFQLLKYSPFPYLTFAPIQILFNQSTAQDYTHGLIVLLIWMIPSYLVLNLILKKGLKNYHGVGI